MEFELKFNSFLPHLRRIAYKFSRTSNVPQDELIGALSEEFIFADSKYNPQKSLNYEAYMTAVLKQFATRYINRSETAFCRNVEYLLDKTKKAYEDTANVDDMLECNFNLEEEVISAIDKRQLINFLMKGEDQVTTAIVNLLLKNPFLKKAEIGKMLGIDRRTVERRIKNLSYKYDESKFGDLDSYLAV